uniref:Kazal-like domain-containing protein n=1 Tax=Musca domestica TaxID=7370 RepID=A0A1I8NJ55_MUSDO
MKVTFILVIICLVALTKAQPFSFPLSYPHTPYRPSPFPFPRPQPVCGVLNGFYKTFSSLQEFLDTVKNGYSFTFHCNGPCPPTHNPCSTVYDPVCATNLVTTKTFSSPCALAEEIQRTGITWVKISNGPCSVGSSTTAVPYVPSSTRTTPTTAAEVTTPEPTTPEPTTPESTTPEPTTTETTTTEATESTTSESTTPEETTAESTTTEASTPETTTLEPSTPETTTDENPETTTSESESSTPPIFSFAALNEFNETPTEEKNVPCGGSLNSFPASLLASPVPSGTVISYRNNVDNNYAIYAEGNVFNSEPCKNNQ